MYGSAVYCTSLHLDQFVSLGQDLLTVFLYIYLFWLCSHFSRWTLGSARGEDWGRDGPVSDPFTRSGRTASEKARQRASDAGAGAKHMASWRIVVVACGNFMNLINRSATSPGLAWPCLALPCPALPYLDTMYVHGIYTSN